MNTKSTLTAPFINTTGELTTPNEMLTALLGKTEGNPASSLYVCKPYINGEHVVYVDIGLEKPVYIPNVMIGGSTNTFKYLHNVTLDALDTGKVPSLPLHYSITGKGINNFPQKAEPTKVLKVSLPQEDVDALKKIITRSAKPAKPDNVGNLNLVRITAKGKQYSIGYMTVDSNPRTVAVLEKLLVNTTLTWHLELTEAGKEWFAAVTE